MILKNFLLILLLLISFFILLILKRFFVPSEIFYYESINLLFLFSIFIIFIMLFLRNEKKKLYLLLNSFIIFILLMYSILITFPTLSKRSLSLYLLNNLEKNIEINDGATQRQVLKLFQNKFLDEDGQIMLRLNEQLSSKNIYQKDNKYFITKRGILINKINTFIIKIFNL